MFETRFVPTTKHFFFTVCLQLLCSCTPSDVQTIESKTVETDSLDAKFELLMPEYGLATAAAGIIREGELVWTGYYGERVPGEQSDAETIFNVASVTKTVTTELALRMAARGDIQLDEPMSEYWIDPDLVDDPRHRELTPRMALAHRTGLPNWRYMDPEFMLRFVREPDSAYGYSGEGMDYLARFLEKKSGRSFESLVAEYVLVPLGMENTSIARREWVVERLALPVDAAGSRHKPFCAGPEGRYCSEEGEWSAADELATTVEDYAALMIAVLNGDGVSADLHDNRLTVSTSTADDPVLSCKLVDAGQCPRSQGYCLGWEVFEFDNTKYVSHGGSDWSERAMVYFEPDSRNGIILFLNGPAESSVDALVEGIRLLDPESRMAAMYQGWIDAYRAQSAE